jgi:hypothetical protein
MENDEYWCKFMLEALAQYRKDKKLDFDSALINLNKSILEYKEIQREKDRKRREDKLNDLGIEDKEDK